MRILSLNEPAIIEVNAFETWNFSKLLLQKDHQYRFKLATSSESWGPASAEGIHHPNAFGFEPVLRIHKEKYLSLMGCIDRIPETAFKIGANEQIYSPPRDGELICFANAVPEYLNSHFSMEELNSLTLQLTRIA